MEMSVSIKDEVTSYMAEGGEKKNKQNKKSKNFLRWHHQTPVGARRLMKAMLLRHIRLKKIGQAGFMIKCSRRIRSSVNKVLWTKRQVRPLLLCLFFPPSLLQNAMAKTIEGISYQVVNIYSKREREPNLSVILQNFEEWQWLLIVSNNYNSL